MVGLFHIYYIEYRKPFYVSLPQNIGEIDEIGNMGNIIIEIIKEFVARIDFEISWIAI